MARIRCSGGIVLEGPERVWLADDPGDEVRDWRPFAAAPVVVGPPDATARDVERARREVLRLVAAGGPMVAAAGVDLGGRFRSARLDGGGESRRDAVLAAVEVLGIDGLERIGERTAVLVALFGVRATRRVGATALEALARSGARSLRLAVAASDVLGPEQLEEVLGWDQSLPPGIVPVPRGNTALLAEHLGAVLGPFGPRRRLSLLRSLWSDVIAWHRSAEALARARQRRFSAAGLLAWQRRIARQNDQWWRSQARPFLGDSLSPAAMLTWVPEAPVWWEALFRSFQETIAATALMRTALAAEEEPVEAAVLAHLEQLAYAATAHLRDVRDRVDAVRTYEPRGWAASDRAAAVAAAAVLATDPNVTSGATDRRGRTTSLAGLLRNVCELSRAVLDAAIEQYRAVGRVPVDVPFTPAVAAWREVAGYSAVRDPRLWPHRGVGPDLRPPLAERLDGGDADPTAFELIDDGLWLMDLADVIARWHGHERAEIDWLGVGSIEVDPPVVPPDFRLPLLESVALALAGGAQLVSLGATPPSRPKSWATLAAGLVDSAEALGFADVFPVAAEIGAWNGRELGATGLTFEVGRTARQLADWGNYMGNCIATYAAQADEKYVLVALRDPAGRLVANVALYRSRGRWRIEQALGRFNDDLPDELGRAIREWADQLQPPRPPTHAPRAGAPSRRTGRAPRGRRAPARERLTRAAAELGEAVGDLRTAPAFPAVEAALRPVATALGWADDDDWLSLFVAVARPRRSGPLAAAVARALASGNCPLAELWEATAYRPLAAALARTGDAEVDLRRLADATVPPSLRLALREPLVWNARVVDVAGRRLRVALGELLGDGSDVLDEAVVARAHVAFLTAAVLALTATPPAGRAVTDIAVANDGTVPGRPRTSVAEPDGPWQRARPAAVELGAAADRIDRALALAPGGRLLVPSAWLTNRGWSALWARAHRTTREVVRGAPRSQDRADSRA